MFPPLFHFIFLVALFSCLIFSLCFQTHGKRWGVSLLFALLFVGILFHQACWQLSGFGSLGFQKFQRRYDVRPQTCERTISSRGRLLDRHGSVLSQALPGKRWGHEASLGEAGLQTIGYVSGEYGLSGLLRVFDARLCGIPPTDFSRRLLKRAVPEDIRLTLDSNLQRKAFNALNGRSGAVVALDPTTGEILVLVSSPSTTETMLKEALRDHQRTPLLNRAIHGRYPPGSVFKIFTAALALENHKAGVYVCPRNGWAPAPSTKPIRDTHPCPINRPNLALRQAFAESSNIWFAKAAIACSWPVFQSVANRCWLNRALPLAVCGERAFTSVAGVIPDLSPYPRRVAYLGFGQGDLLLTPLHVAMLTASIANNGIMVSPHLEQNIQTEKHQFWSPTVAKRVRDLMCASVSEGTSKGIALPGLSIGGKTGTAETTGRDHAWFTCFAPVDHPKIVITVLIEHGGFGAVAALPIARELLREWRKTTSPSTLSPQI